MITMLKFWRKSKISSYFITGTGRCGTMLISKLLSLGNNTRCEHEHSIRYSKVKPAYLTGDMKSLYKEIDTIIEPLVKNYNRKGLIWGESSGLLYLAFEELYRRYGQQVRFILLTRRPDAFVRSALARGFFDPNHPYALEHLRARPTTEIGQKWETTSSFEKCLWYWDLVNGIVYDFFLTLPKELWKIQPIEKFNVSACQQLYGFLGIEGFEEKRGEIEELLSFRINATPGLEDGRHLNPWSTPMTVGDISTWELNQRDIYEKWTKRLVGIFYPQNLQGNTLDG